MNLTLGLFLFVSPALFPEEIRHNWEKAKVVSQGVVASPGGVIAVPIGKSVITLPIDLKSNAVTVETETEILRWVEYPQSGFLILPVNGTVYFYRHRDWFIVLDARKRKHKFSMVGMTVKQ